MVWCSTLLGYLCVVGHCVITGISSLALVTYLQVLDRVQTAKTLHLYICF